MSENQSSGLLSSKDKLRMAPILIAITVVGLASCVFINFGVIENRTGDAIQIQYKFQSRQAGSDGQQVCEFSERFYPRRISGGRSNFRQTDRWEELLDFDCDASRCIVSFELGAGDAVVVNEGGFCAGDVEEHVSIGREYFGRIVELSIKTSGGTVLLSGWEIPKQFKEWKRFCLFEVN